MKKAALFRGPLVAPTSSTWGIPAGIGVVSTCVIDGVDPGWILIMTELMLDGSVRE